MKMNFARIMGQLAMQFADQEALVNIERERRYTFRELHRLTNRIANMMRSRLGLRRGDVAFCILENDNLSLLHAWTAFKGEAAFAHTNIRDALDEHRWQMAFIRPKAVFIETALLPRYADMLREQGASIVCMDAPATPYEGVQCFWDLIEGMPDTDPGIQSDTHADILIYRFTGGTTGRSKCAQYTIDNWLAARDTMYADEQQSIALNSHTRYLHIAPVSHGSGLSFLPTLFRGGCTLTQNAADLKAWCRNVETEKVTTTLMVPTLVNWLLDQPEAMRHDLSSLRTLYYGAAPMSPAKLAQAQARFGNIFFQLYGATECAQAVCTLTPADHLGALETGRLASAGRPTIGIEIRIVDDAGNDVAPGTTGELWLRGRGTIGGYYGNPEGTAAEFADGFWKSGDLGYIDDAGYVFIVDRKKDVIITGGFNVYAAEVEASLNAHPAVQMSAVVGVPHDKWGEAVHAEVVLKPGAAVEPATLIEHVKETLGRFKAPKTLTLVQTLPLSAVGKVLRRRVREKYWTNEPRRVS
ncbi:Long-chain-fatty-acid--CoA ligase [Paraburkholderia caffeinitolerans]|uniref:Long-chain-fatty-acid--CoA ligase n=1 Tax=Paraburkholderia caffeinitolerans TaxID=1723730 RepID=A0A6J5G847_9BURK|nr:MULTISPECIES: AMP-binding protein [Paraburkholderia]CAB3793747.1 Long-chain-fatty-acid--CoA ligase [Paraburkholderia caffeinitolerans]